MAVSKKTYEAAFAKLHAHVVEHGLRESPIRSVVLDKILQIMPQPFTAEELEMVCQEERVSAGTVYNALRLFVEVGILTVLDRERGQNTREYILATEKRNHMLATCEMCGRVMEIHDQSIERIVKDRRSDTFSMNHFTLLLYGVCKRCRNKKPQKQA